MNQYWQGGLVGLGFYAAGCHRDKRTGSQSDLYKLPLPTYGAAFLSVSKVSHLVFIAAESWGVFPTINWVGSLQLWMHFSRMILAPRVFHKDLLFAHISCLLCDCSWPVLHPNSWALRQNDFLRKGAYSLVSWLYLSSNSLYVGVEGSAEVRAGFPRSENPVPRG